MLAIKKIKRAMAQSLFQHFPGKKFSILYGGHTKRSALELDHYGL